MTRRIKAHSPPSGRRAFVWRFSIGLVVLALIAWATVGGAFARGLVVGAMTAADLDGVPVDFADFSGKVLVLNFRATWCAPCVAEMPSLERLREATADLDVRFACVTREEAGVVSVFLATRALNLPLYVLEGAPPECFESRAIPVTFVRGLAATPGGSV